MDKVLVVGSVAFDTVETRAGRREEILGGSASFASLAGSLQAPFRIVAVVGEDFPEVHLELLKGRGVDTSGIERKEGKTFRWSGRYAQDFSTRETLDTQLNVFESFDPVLPDDFKRSEVLFLGNIVPDLQLKVLDQMAERPRLVAADTMNFWISGMRDQLLKVLERIDMLLINDEEAMQLSGEWSVLRAARAVQAMGPRTLIVKRGEHGAFLFEGEEMFYCPGYPLEDVIDPTGAGDSFAGALLSWLAKRGPEASIREALVWATAVASCGVQGFGTERFEDLKVEEVDARVKALHKLVAV